MTDKQKGKDDQINTRRSYQSFFRRRAEEGDPGSSCMLLTVRATFSAKAPVEQGQAQLPLTRKQAEGARIFLAPAQPGGKKETTTIDSLERMHAYEAVWKFDPRATIQEISPIPERLYEHWPFCRCRVRGRVVRPVIIGGTTQELPVCRARVHICEVDRLIEHHPATAGSHRFATPRRVAPGTGASCSLPDTDPRPAALQIRSAYS